MNITNLFEEVQLTKNKDLLHKGHNTIKQENIRSQMFIQHTSKHENVVKTYTALRHKLTAENSSTTH